MFGPFVFLFLLPATVIAEGPIYRCGPGHYADHCGDRPAVIQAARYTLEQFAERTRGRFVCPAHMRKMLYSGEWVCEIPQAVTVEPEKDDRLLKAGE